MRIWQYFSDKFFQPRQDGAEAIVLTQRRVYIVPTGAGLLFAAVVVIMWLGAINYSLGLGHALVFLLAGLGLSGMIHTFRNLAWLTISSQRCDPVFVGEMAHFPMLLLHDRPYPRHALELRAEGNPVVRCDLAPAATAAIALPVMAIRRGWLELPRIRLSSRFPLGLFVAWSYPWPSQRCLVYPKPLDFPYPRAQFSNDQGMQQGEGGREDFAGFREYQPADSSRHIAWKTAARCSDNAPLPVKRFEGGAKQELCLDWNDLPATLDNETRLSILTGWVLAAEAYGTHYALCLPGKQIPPGDGHAHQLRCLETLALAQP